MGRDDGLGILVKLWLYRLLGLIPKKEPRYDFAILDGKLVEFDKPLTTWQAVAELGREEPASEGETDAE